MILGNPMIPTKSFMDCLALSVSKGGFVIINLIDRSQVLLVKPTMRALCMNVICLLVEVRLHRQEIFLSFKLIVVTNGGGGLPNKNFMSKSHLSRSSRYIGPAKAAFGYSVE